MIPTIRVKHSSGTEMVINETDFDSAVHVKLTLEIPQPEANVPEPPPIKFESLDKTEAVAFIATVEEVASLNELEILEKTTKSRLPVLAKIQERRKQLTQ